MWELDPDEVEVIVGEGVLGELKGQKLHLLRTKKRMYIIIQKVVNSEAMCGNCASKNVKAMIVGGGGNLYVVAQCDDCGKMMIHTLESNDEDLPMDVRLCKHMEFGMIPRAAISDN